MPDPLDQLLTDHFTHTLEPHVGRARQAFDDARSRRIEPARQFNWWWLPAVSGSMAAAVIAVVTFLPASPGEGPTGPSPSSSRPPQTVAQNTPAISPQLVEQRLRWDTHDAGTVYDDAVPYRTLFHQQVETQKYRDDATNTQWEITLPQQDVTYVRGQSY